MCRYLGSRLIALIAALFGGALSFAPGPQSDGTTTGTFHTEIYHDAGEGTVDVPVPAAPA